jgi:hypothetical protein
VDLSLTSLSGGGIVSGDNAGAVKLGEMIIVVGLLVQLAFFGLFIIAAGLFHHRLINNRPVKKHVEFVFLRRYWHKLIKWNWRRKGKHTVLSPAGSPVNIDALPWKRHLYVLYSTSTLVLVRSLFRVVEYIQGQDGYFLRHEIYLYVLDAALMFVVMALFNWTHPSEVTELYERRIKESNGIMAQVELQERGEGDSSDIMA